MRPAAAALCAVVVSLTSVLPLGAAEYGTREEAVAMSRRVQEYFAKHGAEATLKAINGRASMFVDRDLFPFVFKRDGSLSVANAGIPSLIGKDLYDLKDQDGKFII